MTHPRFIYSQATLDRMKADIPRLKALLDEGWSISLACKKVGWNSEARFQLQQEMPELAELVAKYRQRRRYFS
jgi:hypothetical protein